MLFFILILVGIIWGVLEKRNKLKNNIHIEEQELNKLYLILLMGIMQLIFRIMSNFYNLHALLIPIEIILLVISLIFIDYNKKIISLSIIEIGFVLNSTVMLFNSGKMPCISNLGIQLDIRHSLMVNTTHLRVLGDIIYLPYPLDILAGLYSIGDIIIAIGLMLLIKNIYRNKLNIF
jgi:hypothetical protein